MRCSCQIDYSTDNSSGKPNIPETIFDSTENDEQDSLHLIYNLFIARKVTNITINAYLNYPKQIFHVQSLSTTTFIFRRLLCEYKL